MRNLRIMLQYFLIPGALALLPWSISRRLAFRAGRFLPWLYREEVEASTLNAHRYGFAPDTHAFAVRLRARLLVEAMDGYLLLLRGRGYAKRWLMLTGDELPDSGPLAFIGSHYGVGSWFLFHAREKGLLPHIVGPARHKLWAPPSFLENVYFRYRHWLLERYTGRALVRRGGASAALAGALDRGEPIFGLCDMPTSRADAPRCEFLGMSVYFPPNMMELAHDSQAPVYLFLADTDLASGKRTLHFQRVCGLDPKQQVQAMARLLEQAIQKDPTGWRFWSIADSLFARGSIGEMSARS